MSDRENPPTDPFDLVCRLDDYAEWLEEQAYVAEALAIRDISNHLKGYIVITAAPGAAAG